MVTPKNKYPSSESVRITKDQRSLTKRYNEAFDSVKKAVTLAIREDWHWAHPGKTKIEAIEDLLNEKPSWMMYLFTNGVSKVNEALTPEEFEKAVSGLKAEIKNKAEKTERVRQLTLTERYDKAFDSVKKAVTLAIREDWHWAHPGKTKIEAIEDLLNKKPSWMMYLFTNGVSKVDEALTPEEFEKAVSELESVGKLTQKYKEEFCQEQLSERLKTVAMVLSGKYAWFHKGRSIRETVEVLLTVKQTELEYNLQQLRRFTPNQKTVPTVAEFEKLLIELTALTKKYSAARPQRQQAVAMVLRGKYAAFYKGKSIRNTIEALLTAEKIEPRHELYRLTQLTPNQKTAPTVAEFEKLLIELKNIEALTEQYSAAGPQRQRVVDMVLRGKYAAFHKGKSIRNTVEALLTVKKIGEKHKLYELTQLTPNQKTAPTVAEFEKLLIELKNVEALTKKYSAAGPRRQRAVAIVLSGEYETKSIRDTVEALLTVKKIGEKHKLYELMKLTPKQKTGPTVAEFKELIIQLKEADILTQAYAKANPELKQAVAMVLSGKYATFHQGKSIRDTVEALLTAEKIDKHRKLLDELINATPNQDTVPTPKEFYSRIRVALYQKTVPVVEQLDKLASDTKNKAENTESARVATKQLTLTDKYHKADTQRKLLVAMVLSGEYATLHQGKSIRDTVEALLTVKNIGTNHELYSFMKLIPNQKTFPTVTEFKELIIQLKEADILTQAYAQANSELQQAVAMVLSGEYATLHAGKSIRDTVEALLTDEKIDKHRKLLNELTNATPNQDTVPTPKEFYSRIRVALYQETGPVTKRVNKQPANGRNNKPRKAVRFTSNRTRSVLDVKNNQTPRRTIPKSQQKV